MASPLCDPLSCDEQTQDWDTGACGGEAPFPGRGWSPAPRYRDDDSDCDNGSASEEEDEAPDDTYWRAKMEAQGVLAPEADYPDWHPAVSATDRVRLVDWIGRVSFRFGLRLKTHVLAVALLDRFLSRDHLEGLRAAGWLAAATALVLAAKVEDSSVPQLAELQRSMECPVVFTVEHLVASELNMLHKLDWSLSAPTSLCYLEFFVRRAAPRTPAWRRELRCRARAMLRRTLADRRFLPFKPSQVAAAALKRALAEMTDEAALGAAADALTALDAAGDLVAVAGCLRALDAAWPRDGGASGAGRVRGGAPRPAPPRALQHAKDGAAGRDESPTSTLSGLRSLGIADSREASPDAPPAGHSAALGVALRSDDAMHDADVAAVRIPRRRAFRGVAAAAAPLLLPAKRRAEAEA